MRALSVNACSSLLELPVSVNLTSRDISFDNMKTNLSESFSSKSGERSNIRLNGKVIHVEGDGRCLFRSLVTVESPKLQKSRRNACGRLERREIAAEETFEADILRSRVVRLMLDNLHFYSQLENGLINADQPFRLSYQKFLDRLEAMSKYNTMPGDLELNAAAMVLERQIIVLDTNLRVITVYGQDRYPQSIPVAVRYTRIRPDVGHYDAVVLNTSRNGDKRTSSQSDMGDNSDIPCNDFSKMTVKHNEGQINTSIRFSEQVKEKPSRSHNNIGFSTSSSSCPSPRVCRCYPTSKTTCMSTTPFIRNRKHGFLIPRNESLVHRNVLKSRKYQRLRRPAKKLRHGYKVFSEERAPRRLRSQRCGTSREDSQCAFCRKRLLVSVQSWMKCNFCGRPAHTQCVIKCSQCLTKKEGLDIYFQCKGCAQQKRYFDSE